MSDLEEAEEAAQHDLHEERRRTEQVVVPDILKTINRLWDDGRRQ